MQSTIVNLTVVDSISDNGIDEINKIIESHKQVYKQTDHVLAWMREVYRICRFELGVSPTKSKETATVDLRRIVTFLSCMKFNVITEETGLVTLNRIGQLMAHIEMREEPYDHATIIHAARKHIIQITNQNKGFQEYAEKYFKVKTVLIAKRFISQSELDEKIKYTYTRG